MPAKDTADKATDNSTSATDASTTQGAAAAGVEQKPATDPTRVVIEQAPAEPAVFYGEGDATNPNRPHVKAEYSPFEW